MKEIHAGKAYSSTFDALESVLRKLKKSKDINKNVPVSTIKALLDVGIAKKGN